MKQADRRQLPYEIQNNLTLRQGRRDWELQYTPQGENEGFILGRYNEDLPSMINVLESSLEPQHRGTGVGQQMYQRWFNAVHDAGFRAGSDTHLSPFSTNIYENVLPQLGYTVTRHPDAYKATGYRSPPAPLPYGWRNPNGDYIFEVHPKQAPEPLAAPGEPPGPFESLISRIWGRQ